MKRILGGACLALAVTAAGAADTGDLWEVTTQMNMAGLPPGMGGGTRQVCTEKGDPKKAMQREDSKCKVTDLKESGTRIQMTMQCPEGTGTMDTTFNAARTEYKGTMKMTSKQGEMTMNTQGRKIGACDPAAAKAQQSAQMDQYKAQSAAAMASVKQSYDKQEAQCRSAADNMEIKDLGLFAHCNNMKSSCDSMAQSPESADMAKTCVASSQAYCKKYQTRDGFLKASRDAETASRMCKVSNAQIKTTLCPQAAKAEDLAFLGSQCPVEAKPLAQAHCAGRSYTSQIKDKYSDFCSAYLSHAKLDEPAPSATSTATSIAKDPAKATTEAVNQGINKLKGLFGR
jgi:hypothetical protein